MVPTVRDRHAAGRRILMGVLFSFLSIIGAAGTVHSAPRSPQELEEGWSPVPGLETMKLEAVGRPDTPLGKVLGLGERLLETPDLFFERMALHSQGLLGREPAESSGEEPARGIARRFTEITVAPRGETVLTSFLESWKARNLRYFTAFGEAEVYTPAFEAGLEEIEMKGLAREQSRMAWDALRDAYFSRYDVAPDRMLRYDAWRFELWRGIDFLLLPPLMAAYLYYRGMDTTFAFMGGELRMAIDPMKALVLDEGQGPEVSAVWSPFERTPAEVIAVGTLRSGRMDLDFIGVGTTLSEVRKALSLQEGP